jgi:hypothetical protein
MNKFVCSVLEKGNHVQGVILVLAVVERKITN